VPSTVTDASVTRCKTAFMKTS